MPINKRLKSKRKKIYKKNKRISSHGNLNIIEGFSDNDSVFSDDYSIAASNDSDLVGSDLKSSTQLLEKSSIITNNDAFEKKIRKQNKNEFLSQFDSLSHSNNTNPTSYNSVDGNGCRNDKQYSNRINEQIQIKNGFSNLDQENGTYNVIDDMTHNNMRPYFSSRKGYGGFNQAMKQRDYRNQRKMELFTGNLSDVDFKHRKEQAPLFKPNEKIDNLYGMSGITQALDGRYIPGKEKRNQKPFEEEKVTPGVGLAPHEKGDGIHDTYRPKYKNVDDLRAKNNKKITYSGRVIKGVRKSSLKRGLAPDKVYKRKPDRYFEKDNPDNPKYTGPEAAKITGKFNTKTQNREKSKEQVGPAFRNVKGASANTLGKKEPTKKTTYETDRAGNIMCVDAKQATGDINNYQAKQTLKEINIKNERIGNTISNTKSKAYDSTAMIPKKTIKELHANNERVGNTIGKTKSKSYDSKSMVPKTTTKELHANNERIGNTIGKTKNKAYNSNSMIPKTTIKELHNKTNRIGYTIGETKSKAYDNKAMIPKTTIKETHNKTNRIGNARRDNDSYLIYEKDSLVPKTTTKELHDITRRIGNTNKERESYNVYDKKGMIPNTTIKQVYSKNKRIGFVDGDKFGKSFNSKIYNPKITLKETINEKNMAGNVKGDFATYIYDKKNNIPKPNMRNVHSKNTYLNNPNFEKQGGYGAQHENTYAPSTIKQMYVDNKQLNPVNNTKLGGYGPDHENTILLTTLKEMHIDNKQLNPIIKNYLGGYGAAHENTYAPATLRQLHTKTKQINPILITNLGGYGPQHENTIAKVTLKQLIENNKFLSHPSFKKNYAYVIKENNLYAMPTMRQMTQDNKYVQPILLGKIGGYAPEHENTTAKTTIKQTTVNNKYVGVLGGRDKDKNREADLNASMNVIKEKIAEGRMPTLSNYNVGPSYKFTSTRLADHVQLKRPVAPSKDWLNKTRLLPKVKSPEKVRHEYTHTINPHINQTLKNNPYINNTQHRSVKE